MKGKATCKTDASVLGGDMHDRFGWFAITWVLIAALMVSPLMAENATPRQSQIKISDRDEASNTALQGADHSLVGTSILLALPPRGTMPAFPPQDRGNRPGGKNSSVVLAL